MPKTDDTPAPTSDPIQLGVDQPPEGGSPDQDGKGDSKTKGPTLQQLALRRMQSMVDENINLLEQGRTSEMNPKVVQLLTRYDDLTSGKPQEDGDRGGYYPSQQPPPSSPAQPSKFEQLGRQAARDQLVTEIRGELEADIITEVWAEDIRALFAELGDSTPTPEEFSAIDFADKRRFPNTRAGFQAWRQAAATFRRERAAASPDGTRTDEGGSAAINADRTKANTKPGQPNPTTVGDASLDVLRATKLNKDGKLDGKAFMEVVRRNVTPGTLNH